MHVLGWLLPPVVIADFLCLFVVYLRLQPSCHHTPPTSNMADEPIQFREIGKLTNLGINQQFINFNHVSLESDKYCAVKEPGEGSNTFRIVDLTTKKVDPHTLKADAVLNHPSARVLAVRSKNKVQVRNLEMDSATGNCTMKEDIVFWKWIDRNMLALITDVAVYHWSLGGQGMECFFLFSFVFWGFFLLECILGSSCGWKEGERLTSPCRFCVQATRPRRRFLTAQRSWRALRSSTTVSTTTRSGAVSLAWLVRWVEFHFLVLLVLIFFVVFVAYPSFKDSSLVHRSHSLCLCA